MVNNLVYLCEPSLIQREVLVVRYRGTAALWLSLHDACVMQLVSVHVFIVGWWYRIAILAVVSLIILTVICTAYRCDSSNPIITSQREGATQLQTSAITISAMLCRLSRVLQVCGILYHCLPAEAGLRTHHYVFLHMYWTFLRFSCSLVNAWDLLHDAARAAALRCADRNIPAHALRLDCRLCRINPAFLGLHNDFHVIQITVEEQLEFLWWLIPLHPPD